MPETVNKNIGLLIELFGLALLLISAGVQFNINNVSESNHDDRLSKIEEKLDTLAWLPFFFFEKPETREHTRHAFIQKDQQPHGADSLSTSNAILVIRDYIFPLYLIGSLLVIGGRFYREWQTFPATTPRRLFNINASEETTNTPTDQLTEAAPKAPCPWCIKAVASWVKTQVGKCNIIKKQRFWAGVVCCSVFVIVFSTYSYAGLFEDNANQSTINKLIWCLSSTCFGFGCISLTYLSVNNSKLAEYLLRYIPLLLIITALTFTFGERFFVDYTGKYCITTYTYYISTFATGGGLGFYIDKLSDILKIKG